MYGTVKKILLFIAAAAAATVAEAGLYYALPGHRVLMMNNDGFAWFSVAGQSYDDVKTGDSGTGWVHYGDIEHPAGLAARRYPNLKSYQTHDYYIGGILAWRLNECWAGNAYWPNDVENRNWLPWSSSAKSIADAAKTATDPSEAGSIVMRNIEGASVTSPFYEEGIGAIYFDAVNVSVQCVTSRIALQVATNAIETAEDGTQTRRPALAGDADDALDWEPVQMDVMAVANCANIVKEASGVTEFALASTAASTNLFYRMRARLNWRSGAKFRIIRLDRDTTPAIANTDDSAFIQIDSIFASPPPETVELSQRGEYDPELAGKDVLGYENAFTTPFPSLADTNLNISVSVTYIVTNGTQTMPQLLNPSIHYRWRYLDQVKRNWSTIGLELGEDLSTVSTSSPVPRDEELAEADLEYYFDTGIDGAFFRYLPRLAGTPSVDWPDDFTERISYASLTHSTADATPAGSTNMFVRLREGESDYRGVRLEGALYAESAAEDPLPGAGSDGTIHMELVGDHRWRAYMQTGTNHVGRTLYFAFRLCGHTEPGADRVGTNELRVAAVDGTIESLPYSGFSAASETAWCKYTLDSDSGYIMLELDDRTLSTTVSHAEYQNFNTWTRALGDKFDGNYISTSGVSSVKSAYSETFFSIPLDNPTNEFWRERFNLVSSTGEYYYDKYFTIDMTPNGWDAKDGIYVREKRESYYADSFIVTSQAVASVGMALEMLGSGRGAVSCTANADDLDGIEKVTLSARLSQSLELNDFAFYEDGTSLKNYGFSAYALMSSKNGTDMSPVFPSMSLVAYYRPSQGCYEFRVERSSENGMTISLFRWELDPETRSVEPTNLVNWVTAYRDKNGQTINNMVGPDGKNFNNKMISGSPVTSSTGTRMFITCSNTLHIATNTVGGIQTVTTQDCTRVSVGLAREAGEKNTDVASSSQNFMTLVYDDVSERRFTRGTYGLCMTDCRGGFAVPTFATNLIESAGNLLLPGSQGAIAEDHTGSNHLRVETMEGNWTIPPGRMTVTNIANRAAVVAEIAEQPLALDIARRDGDNINWVEWGRTNVVSFGTNSFTFALTKRGAYYVRLRHAAEYNEPRVDITADDIVIWSWRALDSTRVSYENDSGWDEWVYTQGWPVRKSSGSRDTCIMLYPHRASPDKPCGVRSRILDGVSLVTFDYLFDSAKEKQNCVLELQICTNYLSGGTYRPPITQYSDALRRVTIGDLWNSDACWVTKKEYNFASMPLKGSLTYLFENYYAPVKAVVRLRVKPSIVSNAETDPGCAATRVKITSMSILDEPEIDIYGWTGWNMLTTTNAPNSYMPDPAITPFPGLSAMLNNSTNVDLKETKPLAQYGMQIPYIQTPSATNGLGLVMFRARKAPRNALPAADASYDPSVPAYITIYGSESAGRYDDWTALTNIEVTAQTYRNYSWRLGGSSSRYGALRFAVKGVTWRGTEEPVVKPVQRVLIDEISVSELLEPKLVFLNFLPFRSNLSSDEPVDDLASCDEQPLIGESFGFQCEMKVGQLADEIDTTVDGNVSVELYYYPSSSPWGFKNWEGRKGAVRCELKRCSLDSLVFRSSYSIPASIVPPQQASSNPYKPVVVQYYAKATWIDKAGNHYEGTLEGNGGWNRPAWYHPLDFNSDYGDFSAYTILDAISPYRAWINCVNLNDSADENTAGSDWASTNQFIELAVPAGMDMTGWKVRACAGKESGESGILFELGRYGAQTVKKTAGATNLYAFLTVQSPVRAKCGGVADGTWSDSIVVKRGSNELISKGAVGYRYGIGFELLRPTGIVEHRITVDNVYTRYWADDEPGYWEKYTGEYLATNTLAEAGTLAGAKWLFAGVDNSAGTLGVMGGHGEDRSVWESDLMPTPGAVNRRRDGSYQSINPDLRYLLPPNGTNYWIVARVLTDHIVQNASGNTEPAQVIIVPSGASTNIVYTADKFYMVSSIATNGVQYDLSAVSPARVFTLQIDNMSANLNIDASADVSSAVSALFGEDDDERYRPHVLKWLQDRYGDYEAEDLKLAGYYDFNGKHVRDLTLTEMYWLDINPVEQCRFVAGIGDPLDRLGRSAWPVYTERGGVPVTNIQTSVFMMITNTVTGEAYPPYVINGLGQDSVSFVADSGGKWNSTQWTSATLNVSCRLAEKIGDANPKWVPLRWFFFGADSFCPADSETPFRARIELGDPFKRWSPAYSEGYTEDMEGKVLFFRWNIDHTRKPDTVDLLRTNSVTTVAN